MRDNEKRTGLLYGWKTGDTAINGHGSPPSMLQSQALPNRPPVPRGGAGELAAHVVGAEEGAWSLGSDAYHHLLGGTNSPGRHKRRFAPPTKTDPGRMGPRPRANEVLPSIRSIVPGPEVEIALTAIREVWGWGGTAVVGIPGDEVVGNPAGSRGCPIFSQSSCPGAG